MEINEINNAVRQIAEKKIELSKIDYADKKYDEVEEELHDLEDAFIDKYGSLFESVLSKVHKEYCPDTEVLLPTAYFANEYKKDDKAAAYDVDLGEGVVVESDKTTSKVARLVIVPSPVRILFQSQIEKIREEVWNIARQPDAV